MTIDKIICPACQHQSACTEYYIKLRNVDDSDFGIVKCGNCNHRFFKFTKEQIKKIEQVYAHSYIGHRFDSKANKSFIKFTKANIDSTKTTQILDVGCGAGEFLQQANLSGMHGMGIDISEGGIDLCKKSDVDAVVGDFLVYKFNKTFDLITFWDVLEHLSNPLANLKRAYELLPANGKVLAKIPYYQSLDFSLIRFYNRLAILLLQAPGHMQFYTPQSLELLSQKAGFNKVVIKKVGSLRAHVNRGFAHRIKKSIIKAIKNLAGDGNYFVVFEK